MRSSSSDELQDQLEEAADDDAERGEESIAGSDLTDVDMPSVPPVCFGQILKQLDASASLLQPCVPNFVQGNKRLTDKFCGCCRSGFYVPYSHVRALPPAKAERVRADHCPAAHATPP